jgi:hypothetical protein
VESLLITGRGQGWLWLFHENILEVASGVLNANNYESRVGFDAEGGR